MMDDTLTMPEPSTAFAAAAPRSTALDDIDALHATHHRKVFNYFLMSLRDRDAAYSLTQDTFLKVWKTRDSFRGDCSASTWLMRVAVNLLRDHTRRGAFQFWRKAEQTSVDATEMADAIPSGTRSAEQMLIAQQQVSALWGSLSGLSEKQRTVFTLRYIDEMELSDIATATGLPLSTVKTHLYRALERVRTAVTTNSAKGVTR